MEPHPPGKAPDSQPPQRRKLAVFTLLGILLAILGAMLVPKPGPPPEFKPPLDSEIPDARLITLRPQEEPHGDFVGSAACAECHRDNHGSWSNSWHRTMTQKAGLDSFVGSLDPDIEAEGNRFSLFARDGLPWFRISTKPPGFTPLAGDRREFPIVMTSGSHHMQLGWFPVGLRRTLALMPLAYLVDDRRWVPHATIFLQPPEQRSSTRVGIWNEYCNRCHTTGPEPRRRTGNTFERTFGFDTRVAEFGISCEACHGPGRRHAELRRQTEPGASPSGDPIVNPKSLNHERASEICGACHGDAAPRSHHRATPFHLPGQRLTERYSVSEPPKHDSTTEPGSQPDDEDGVTMYWADGQARASGTAFSGLRISRCYTEGDISCLSCHAMHQPGNDSRPVREWADDMLRSDALTDAACLRCHDPARFAVPGHTIHTASSAGSRCYNCHMPHTSYGLLKAIRSHTITSPSVAETLRVGRLNACNLCHLDKSLTWTDAALHRHYGTPPESIPDRDRDLSAAVLQALSGDAGQRALVAWAMAWPPAVAASGGNDWIPPHLANLLEDPYHVVRLIAGRSIRSFARFADLDYDYLAATEKRRSLAGGIIADWQSEQPHPAALIQASGKLDPDRFRSLRAARDDRAITILE